MENTVIIKRIEWVTVQTSTKMLAFSHFVCKICYHSPSIACMLIKTGMGVNCNKNDMNILNLLKVLYKYQR